MAGFDLWDNLSFIQEETDSRDGFVETVYRQNIIISLSLLLSGIIMCF